MLRHIVMFRRRADIPRNDALESALAQRMAALGAQIPVITAWIFRKNELERPICWDYVLQAEVAHAQGLNDYIFHPLHQALVADLKGYFDWAAVDYTA